MLDGSHVIRASGFYGAGVSYAWRAVDVVQNTGDTTVPTITILTPKSGVVITGDEVPIALVVADDTEIRKVTVNVGDVELAELPPGGPWELDWTQVPPGDYKLVAHVSDGAGHDASDEARITVGSADTAGP